MNRTHIHAMRLATALSLAALAACFENPAGIPQPPEEEVLSVDFSFTPDHVHILQSEVVFTVAVTNQHGEAVTDFETLNVERLAAGTDTWRATELALDGTVYRGTYTFGSSGEYRLRVTGQRPGQHEAQLLHEVHDPMHVARAHAEAGDYRVEFEPFPGHVHEGDAATLRFWVMAAEEDESGARPPIPGLALQVHCLGPEAGETFHAAHEAEPGVYEAEHTFAVPEETHVALHFDGAGGHHGEAEFHLHVAHGH